MRRHGHDSVDLGSLAIRAGLARGIHQYFDGGPDQKVTTAGGNGVLEFGALADPLGHQVAIDLVVEVGGVRAGLIAEGEEADPVQLSFFDPCQEVVMVGLGLPRIPHDEGGPEGGGRLGGADRSDALEEALALAPAPHALQHGPRYVLEREVEVRHAGGQYGFDQRVIEGGGVEVEEPGPPHPRRHCGHQVDDGPVAAHGGAVDAGLGATGRSVEGERGEVLGHEHHLGQRSVRSAQLVDFGQDRLGRARALLAPEGGDGAEPAVAVAALGHLDIRPWGRRVRPGQVEEVEVGDGGGRGRLGAQGDRRAAGWGLRRCRGQERCTEGSHQVDLGEGLGQLIAVAFGHAARHHEACTVLAGIGQFQDGVDRFLSGGLDEGTGVDHDQIRIFGGVGGFKAVHHQGADQFV